MTARGNRVTRKGQVTIPVTIRRKLGVEPGDRVIFKETDGVVTVERARNGLDVAFGAVASLHRPEDFAALERGAEQAIVSDVMDELES